MINTYRQIRAVLRKAYGDRNYRITSDGEIHVYGIMPNTSQRGWHLFGYMGHPDTRARLETLAQ